MADFENEDVCEVDLLSERDEVADDDRDADSDVVPEDDLVDVALEDTVVDLDELPVDVTVAELEIV